MTVRPLLTKLAFSLFFILAAGFAIPGSILLAAENTTIRSIDSGTGNLSPQQIEQIIQNATPEQIQQILENAPAKKRIAPYETIYKVEEPEEDQLKKLREEQEGKFIEEQVSEDLEQEIAIEEEEEEEEKIFSAIEQLYQQKYDSTLAESLEQFGYTIFESSTDTLSKLAVPRDDYLIGPGDTLRIRFWGNNLDGAYSVIVSRDGTIDVPQIGILPIAGTQFGKLEEVILHEAEKYVQGINIHISLEELRSIEVYVVGEINRPGLHLVPPFSSVIGGLLAGEGVKKSGSLRTIKLFRAGNLYQVVDLYSLLLKGSRDGDVTLQDGDVLFVPRLGPTAAVAGASIQPAIYELTTESSVADLLELAGGALPQSSKDRLYLRRFDNNKQFVVLDIDKRTSRSDLTTIPIRNGDLLELQYLEALWPEVVRLEGNVWFPDVFNYRSNLKLSDILTDISLLKPNSITDFAILYRYDPRSTRYVVERFPLSDVLSGQYDADLNPYDKIEILSRDDYGIQEPVKIVGSVWRPDDYVFSPGLTLGDLLGLAGGFKFDADPQRIDLSRQIIEGGEVTTSHFTLQAGTDASFKLQPYDYIYIRRVKDAASFKSVSITGEVKFPGDYRIKDGERLSDLIERAGGFTEKAYFYGAYFVSMKAQEIQQISIDRMIDDLELRAQTVLSEQAQLLEDKQAISGQQLAIQKLISRLRQVKATGRMSITMGPLASLKNTAFDFELHEGDSLHIPMRPNFVSVVGSVYISKSYMYKANMNVGDYLQKAGGPTKTADDKAIYVVKANGEILAAAQSKGMFNNFEDTVLMPGDTIVVPEDLDRVPTFKVIKDVADIVFKIATTAGIIWAI
jgi:protein involved in polysaccharide export with SLBB domain